MALGRYNDKALFYVIDADGRCGMPDS